MRSFLMMISFLRTRAEYTFGTLCRLSPPRLPDFGLGRQALRLRGPPHGPGPRCGPRWGLPLRAGGAGWVTACSPSQGGRWLCPRERFLGLIPKAEGTHQRPCEAGGGLADWPWVWPAWVTFSLPRCCSPRSSLDTPGVFRSWYIFFIFLSYFASGEK